MDQKELRDWTVTRTVLKSEEDIAKFVDTMYGGRDTKIVDVQAYRYDSKEGQMIQSTYTPSAYRKYHVDTSRRKIKKSPEPYVKFGYDNKYPFFLHDLTTKSSIHKRTVKTIANTAYGKGLTPCNKKSRDFHKWAKQFLTPKKIKTVLENIATYGGAFISYKFGDPVGRDRKRKDLIRIGIDQFYNWRVGKPEEDGQFKNEINYFWHHPHYNTDKVEKKYLKGVPIFRGMDYVIDNVSTLQSHTREDGFYENPVDNVGEYATLIGEPETDTEFYPTPSYITDTFIDAAMVDAALSSFDIAGLKNGLSAGYIITVPVSGIEKIKKQDPEKYEAILNDVKLKTATELEGDENNGVSVVVVQDVSSKGQVPVAIDIKEIPHTNTGDIHKIIEERKNRNILTAWGVPDSMIVGIPPMTGVGFASQAEKLKIASQLFYDQTVFPEIVDVFEQWVNSDLRDIWIEEEGIDIEFEEDNEDEIIGLKLQRAKSFTITPDASMLEAYFLLDEIRELLGYGPLTDDQEALLMEQRKERAEIKAMGKSAAGETEESTEETAEPEANAEKAFEEMNSDELVKVLSMVARKYGSTLPELLNGLEI
jgi:hypothetical protein